MAPNPGEILAGMAGFENLASGTNTNYLLLKYLDVNMMID